MVSQKLIDAVQAQDVDQIRIIVTNIAYHDRGFYDGKFEEAIDYVKKNEVPGLWQKYDGEDFNENKEDWNGDYWADLTASLMDNFCEERIAKLKEVGRYVYPQQAEAGARPTSPPRQAHTTGQRTGSVRPSARRTTSQGEMPPVAWLVGGAAVLLLGCATIGVTKTLVATAAVAGGAVLLNNKGR